MNFYVFRHGQTDWNTQRRIQGHTDIELNEVGRGQALDLGKRIQNLNIEVIHSSNLKRALETAKLALPKIKIFENEQLREAHFGEAEGKIFTDVIEEYGDDYFRTQPKYWDLRIAGSETKRECIDRVWSALNQIARESKIENIGISTHGGVIRNIVHSILPEDTPKVEISNCCVYHFKFKNNKWSLIGLLK